MLLPAYVPVPAADLLVVRLAEDLLTAPLAVLTVPAVALVAPAADLVAVRTALPPVRTAPPVVLEDLLVANLAEDSEPLVETAPAAVPPLLRCAEEAMVPIPFPRPPIPAPRLR